MTSSNNSLLPSRRMFLKLATVTGVTIASAGIIYGNTIEPYDIEITTNPIRLPNLAPEFENYKLVQISDLHMGSWLNRERLTTVVNIINSMNPDLVAITGDYVTLGRIKPYADDLVDTLSQIQASDGVVSVLGNHDHWANVELTREVLKSANIIELPNESMVLTRGSAKFVIAGLDDVWEEQHDLDKLISTLPTDVPTILLAHEPDIADETSQTGYFELQISGHSHGGQIRLPIINALYLPRLGQKYPMGRYQVNQMVQYTNRGIGMADLPIRIRCRPEISVFTFSSQAL